MPIGSVLPLGVRTGYATGTTCSIVVASLVAGDITITGNFTTKVITPVQVGTDGTVAGKTYAGYVGSGSITGLQAFTRYTYTATQGGNSVTGSFMTAPLANSDFSFFFGSCDNNTSYSGSPTGFYNIIEEYIKTGQLPTVGILFVDDLGYVDLNRVNDSTSGHYVNNSFGAYYNAKIYDYALGYMSGLGMFSSTTDNYAKWGRDSSRVYCTQNMNLWPQWGDHEFVNDIGWQYPTDDVTTVIGNTGIRMNEIFLAGKSAWNSFIAPLQPPFIRNLDNTGNASGGSNSTTAANHWGFTLGCVSIMAPDMITHSNGSANSTVDPTVVYGSNQIKDCLSFLDTSASKFNILGLAHSIRYLEALPGVTSFNGAQHPLFNHILPEYQQFFTAVGNPVKSIMDNPKTNGFQGVTCVLHGDYHHANVTQNKNGNENFYSVCIGTINGSLNFDFVTGITAYGGTNIIYDSLWAEGAHNYAGVRVDVYGSKAMKEMHVILFNASGVEVWHGRFIERSSNESLPTSWSRPSVISGKNLNS